MYGFLGFVIDGEEKIVKAEYGFAPDQLGVGTLRLLREWGWAMRAEARKLRLLDVGEGWSEEDADRINLLRESLRAWPEIAAETVLRAGVAVDGWSVPSDSGNVPWGYVVDLDHQFFEVYEGFQQCQHDEGRFCDRPRLRRSWWPVRLVARFPIPAATLGLPALATDWPLPTDEGFLAAVRGGARIASWPGA